MIRIAAASRLWSCRRNTPCCSTGQQFLGRHRRFVHSKKRRRHQRLEDEKLLSATERTAATPDTTPSLMEVMGWQPLLLIGVAPLVGLGVLCIVRPELREQVLGLVGDGTTNEKK